jgi:hypothetical protein
LKVGGGRKNRRKKRAIVDHQPEEENYLDELFGVK